MDTIYLTSLEPKSGKTLLATALGSQLLESNVRLGYAKPVGARADGDSAFVQGVLGPVGATAPAVVRGPDETGEFTPNERAKIKAAVDAAGKDVDVLLVEGSASTVPFEADILEMLNGRAVLVAWFAETMDIAAIQSRTTAFGDRMAGVIVNGLPPSSLRAERDRLMAQFREAGLPLLGTVPQDRVLDASTIREIATHLDGDIRYYPENADELVENIMIGALALDGGLQYFEQKSNKLVVTRWDRPDMQNAAIESETRGFVLTGGEGPIPYMQSRIEEKEIPVVVVQDGTIATASKLSGAFSRGSLHPDKVERAAALVQEHVDLGAILPSLSGIG